MKIENIQIQKILTSAGKPTVQISVNGFSASVPFGTSAGKHEVNAFGGTVDSSIDFFKKEVKPQIMGMEFENLADVFSIEKQLQGFIPKIGGNPVLCLSYALLRNIDKDVYKVFGTNSIPYQVCNIIGGGKHGKGTEIQEFLAIPMTKDYPKSMEASAKVHKLVGEKLKAENVGLEGAWISKIGNEKSLEILKQVADSVSQELKFDIKLGLDVAASEFYENGKYVYHDKKLDTGEQIEFMLDLIKRFNLHYVEDPLDEDDFEGFAELQKKTNSMVVGDDLFTTNDSRLKPVCKAAIVKPNQIGMMYRVVDFMEALKRYGMTAVISHRSQETDDQMLADLAVGLGTPYIKVSVRGGVRVAKMERIKQIYKELSHS